MELDENLVHVEESDTEYKPDSEMIDHYRKQTKRWHSTTKCLLWFIIINSVAWIWCSYILAWFDKVQIAESLSSNVCTVARGQIFGYLITKTVENIFKYNNFGGKSKYTE